ncbi:YceI family protein [Rugamonas apoptosis]|uniref:YceI family protein n=1 Tax=Rugamonas apoptosis TaxID=2758570 RepID=A0A7W2ILQ4_9BURK|nr:YceI family protein [Rugamonas apoptosis]MBA5688863.1 YceI family protein [Rugamonas apoptosis]
MTFTTTLHRLHPTRLAGTVPACLLACLLAACAPAGVQQEAPAPAASPIAAPAADWRAPYLQWQTAGQSVLRIDTQRSLITVLVRRAGPLARFGHDHVVAIRQMDGYVAPAHNRADFQFRLDQMTVDEAELRTAAGLAPQPTADAIAGTRHNMLARVLDADHFPLVQVHAERSDGDHLQASVTLHGITRVLPMMAQRETDGAGLRVRGAVTLKQTDFGLVPFSVMGGAMAVQDELELRFDLRAN